MPRPRDSRHDGDLAEGWTVPAGQFAPRSGQSAQMRPQEPRRDRSSSVDAKDGLVTVRGSKISFSAVITPASHLMTGA